MAGSSELSEIGKTHGTFWERDKAMCGDAVQFLLFYYSMNESADKLIQTSLLRTICHSRNIIPTL